MAALMEGVRGWEDSGTFKAQLFDETFHSLCCQTTSAEALSYFISTYLDCPDVRWVVPHLVKLTCLTVLQPSTHFALVWIVFGCCIVISSMYATPLRQQSSCLWFIAVPCMCRYYTLKSTSKLLQQKTVSGPDHGRMQQGGEHPAGADQSIPTVTDVLMHITPHIEGCADRHPWCGGGAAQSEKGALSSRERRKRKRKEVSPALRVEHPLCVRVPGTGSCPAVWIWTIWFLGVYTFAYPMWWYAFVSWMACRYGSD